MMTACFHRDHSRLIATQKNLSNRLRAGRGRRRFSTVNCCRSTKFSKMRSRRLRKSGRSDPNASQSTLSIIGVITEFWQRAAGYVIDFKVGQSFGEAQACWAVRMDVGVRFTGVVSGARNTMSQIGATISSIVFGYMVRSTGSYNIALIPVVGMIPVYGIFCMRI